MNILTCLMCLFTYIFEAKSQKWGKKILRSSSAQMSSSVRQNTNFCSEKARDSIFFFKYPHFSPARQCTVGPEGGSRGNFLKTFYFFLTQPQTKPKWLFAKKQISNNSGCCHI